MATKIITYVEAKAKGLKRYFTGKRCKYDHVSERMVSNCCCIECAYARTAEWASKNPELKKKFRDEWNERNPSYRAEWARNNPDSHRIAARKWYEKDIPARRKKATEWQKANPEKVRANCRNRIALKKKAKGTHTADQVLKMLKKQNWICVALGCNRSIRKTENRHIDHIMPLILGGSNDISNLQGLCGPCNCSKNKKHPDAWIRELKLKFGMKV